MKLVLTNDDGIDAPGLKALEHALDGLGTPIIVAPALPNSEVSHAVTTHSPIRIERAGENRYRIFGTPADCVRLALTKIVPEARFVFSGINRGGNLGADVYISGTVAAAREAALLGVPGAAISHYVAMGREVDWELAARRIARLLPRLMTDELPASCFWNVNLPHPKGSDESLEVVFCPLDTNRLAFDYNKDGDCYLYEGNYHNRARKHGRDVEICFGGRITVTRIPLEMTQE